MLYTNKERLSFLFLQFQRTLILAAIRFYEKFDSQSPKLSPRILDLEDETEINRYLDFLESLQNKLLVRLAIKTHLILDRSKNLKAFTISLLLFFRDVFRFHENNGPYRKWSEVVDCPTRAEVAFWQKTLAGTAADLNLTIVFCPNSFQRATDFLSTIQANDPYKPHWLGWASNENLKAFPSMLDHHIASNFDADFRQIVNESGEFILFQTEPGFISERALPEILGLLKAQPTFLLAFGDGDSISDEGLRSHPRFYPAWNLRYFVGDNPLRGLLLFSKVRLLDFMKDKSFASWEDFLAQLAVDVKDNDVIHIPKILFHSKSDNDPCRSQLNVAIARTVKTKYGAEIEESEAGVRRIRWSLPASLPRVSFVIPTRDRVSLVKTLIDGILEKTDYDNFEILIVNNQSSEQNTLEYLKEIETNPKIRVLNYDHPFNFSAINNFAVQHATGEILALLNNDLEIIHSSWLKEMIREALAPEVGIVGAKLFLKNNYIQHAGVVLGSGLAPFHVGAMEPRSKHGYRNRLRFAHQLSAVTGACMVMRRKVFTDVGGFNEKDLSVAYNDIDLCLRVIESGLKIVWTPMAELYHLESASRPPDRRPEQIARYRKEVEFMRNRWRALNENDPFYNPQFSKTGGHFKVSIDANPNRVRSRSKND